MFQSEKRFEVELLDPCLYTSFTIDEMILEPVPFKYVVGLPEESRALQDEYILEDMPNPKCPATYEFQITMRDGTELAADFPIQYDPQQQKLSV